MTDTFVIAGGGLAGGKAAETLREEGFDGRLVLIGAEPERPYERPPLSKDHLRGDAERETIYVHPEGFYAESDIELKLGRRAVELDLRERELVLDDGVLYLRSVADCDVLRGRLDQGGSVVVVGAGWIGCEVAASARSRGLEVTVVDPQAVPLERVLGREVGAVYRDVHLDHGVRMQLGTGVDRFEGAGAVERVRTSDGDAIECDFVIVGVGVRPRIELAERAGIAVGDGILADERLQTDASGVFVAGDVAGAQHPFYGERVRVEHWANALEQGPVAARNMLGRGLAYERLPYFFSDQYDVGMEYTGYARTWDRVVFRGDPATREFIAFWLDGDRVVAGMNVNVWGVVEPIQRLISERIAVDDERLGDPDVPLEMLASLEQEASS